MSTTLSLFASTGDRRRLALVQGTVPATCARCGSLATPGPAGLVACGVGDAHVYCGPCAAVLDPAVSALLDRMNTLAQRPDRRRVARIGGSL